MNNRKDTQVMAEWSHALPYTGFKRYLALKYNLVAHRIEEIETIRICRI